MMRAPLVALRRRPDPLLVGLALLVSGAGTYGFLVMAARSLGPDRYSALSALWSLVVLVAPGVFIPLEQEVARAIASRRARGIGEAPVAAKALGIGAVMTVALVALAAATSPLYLDSVLDGSPALLAGLVLGIPAYALLFLERGVLSGTGRLRAYAVLVGAEGVFRVVAAAALFAAHSTSPGAYGLLIGGAALPACALVAIRARQALAPGPPAELRELTTALGLLLTGSLMGQVLVNAGPLMVKVLADKGQEAATGRFLAGLVLARIPLFLFQAVQAAVLPRLASLLSEGNPAEFRRLLGRMVGVVAVLTAFTGLAAFVVGPTASRVVFGEGFVLARRDLALLALGNGAFLLAQALAQGAVALRAYRSVAAAWTAGVVASLVVVALGGDLLLRVGAALVVGSLVTGGVLAATVARGASRAGQLQVGDGQPVE